MAVSGKYFRGRRLWLCLGVCSLLAAVYFLFDPSQAPWMPKCPVYSLTGLECPGCGSQRLFHALLHGDIAGAWRANAFLLLLIPWLAVLGWLEAVWPRHQGLYSKAHSLTAVILTGVAIVVWTVMRNIAPLAEAAGWK